jgi:hypothetical protein
MYAKRRISPTCRRAGGSVFSYGQDCPLLSSLSRSTYVWDPHVGVVFNLPFICRVVFNLPSICMMPVGASEQGRTSLAGPLSSHVSLGGKPSRAPRCVVTGSWQVSSPRAVGSTAGQEPHICVQTREHREPLKHVPHPSLPGTAKLVEGCCCTRGTRNLGNGRTNGP